MDRLTPGQRMIVAARCGDGLTVKETAAVLRLSRHTILNQSGEAIRRLEAASFHQVCCAYGAAGRPDLRAMRAKDV